MSLKIIAALAIVAGLMTQTTAFVITGSQYFPIDEKIAPHKKLMISSQSSHFTPTDINKITKEVLDFDASEAPPSGLILIDPDLSVSGFNFSAEKTPQHDKLTVVAPRGSTDETDLKLYTSRWSINSDALYNVTTITQELLLNGLAISYDNVEATVGDVTTAGRLYDVFFDLTFGVALSASAPGGEFCKLETTVEVVRGSSYTLNFQGFGENYEDLNEPDVSKGLGKVVATTVVSDWTKILAGELNAELGRNCDVEKYCKALLNNFVAPDRCPPPKHRK